MSTEAAQKVEKTHVPLVKITDYQNGALVAQQMPKVTLNDGIQMPMLGFGTSDVKGTTCKPGDPDYEAIKHAIRVGYRFIDTAALYGNERTVGCAIEDALRENLVPNGDRRELFVCTKLWCTQHKRASVVQALRESLERLKLDYVDLYLIHWPVAYQEGLDPVNPRDPNTGKILYSDTTIQETWQGMEDCKDLGLARSIGISNFNHKQCDEVLQMCKHKPSIHQLELHPYLTQTKLHAYSNKAQIQLNAYCPLGAPGTSWNPKDKKRLLDDELICSLAKKYQKSEAQIVLRYHLQRGIAPIPKSITPARIEQNLQVFNFELSEEDLSKLDQLNCNLRYCLWTAGEIVDDHPLYPFHEEY